MNDFEGRLDPFLFTLGLTLPEKFLILLPEGRDRLFDAEEDWGREDWGRVFLGRVKLCGRLEARCGREDFDELLELLWLF